MAIKGQDKAADTGLILVGRIAGAFGVRGEVRLSTYTEDPMSLVAYGPLLGQDGRTVLTLTGSNRAGAGRVFCAPSRWRPCRWWIFPAVA